MICATRVEYALRVVHAFIKVVLFATERLVFPDNYKWKKTSAAADIVLTAALMSNAVLEMTRFPRSKKSRRISKLLPSSEAELVRAYVRGFAAARLYTPGVKGAQGGA